METKRNARNDEIHVRSPQVVSSLTLCYLLCFAFLRLLVSFRFDSENRVIHYHQFLVELLQCFGQSNSEPTTKANEMKKKKEIRYTQFWNPVKKPAYCENNGFMIILSKTMEAAKGHLRSP